MSKSKNQYLLFYKPYGVLCQFTNPGIEAQRPTLKDYINIPDVYSVGRLDLDSEGLLLLTNNGAVKHRLGHRQFAHQRSYWVQVEGIPTAAALQQLTQGVLINRELTRPALVKLLTTAPPLPPRYPPIRDRRNIPTSWLELILTEGRNRQVRRMTAAVGYPTLRLVRFSINIGAMQLTLTGLDPGQWRYLTPQEQQAILQL
ncbi:pseudouridine synthase [Gloeocapsa sp. PCC 73106]|uniref:pseudouridine synthase n=1 Tax=Gloeocapsa sp. PCC 73106 TaxID=102232 RepID=UPI0005582E4E|nr:pseudouridine synthase [Gloeocapsa sp. PCC 73106]